MGFLAALLSFPILLFVAPPFVFLCLLKDALVGMLQKFFATISRASPNVSGDKEHPPVPLWGAFTGTVFGYFKYMGPSGGWVGYQVGNTARTSQVCGFDDGHGTVNLADRASAESVLAGNTCANDEHPINLAIASELFAGQVPNFTRHGDLAVRARAFLLEVIPQDPSTPRLAHAVAEMQKNIQTWATQNVSKPKLADLLNEAVLHFSTTLLLGAPLDTKLIFKVFPFPVSGLLYPKMPACLLGPIYQRAKSASAEIWKKMQASPNWPLIKEAADRHGLEYEAACGNVLIAATFNAFGLGNSLMNAFYVLPNLPEGGQELLRDDELLQSMAWELLRNNGPGENYICKEDRLIPTSAGVTHRVKKGTNLYFHMGHAQRDGYVWKDANEFRVDRFKPLPPATLKNPEGDLQPLPTICFGCPLGTMTDEAQHKRSHQCAFIHLAQPFLAQYIEMLVSNFVWQVKGYEAKAGTNGAYSFDYSATHVIKTSGDPGQDNTPRVKGGDTRLAFFNLRGSVGGEIALEVLSFGAKPLLDNQ